MDTYWSDHCRHTTFSTELTDVKFGEGDYREPIEKTYEQYLGDRAVLYKDRDDKFVCLMDLALMAMKKLKSEGKLQDQEESDEINACSIVVPVDVNGEEEEWLINFKMRPITILQRLNLLVAQLPVLEEQSVTRFQEEPMYIRQCV